MNRTIIFWRAVGGSAGAEFALLLPLLTVLLFGGIEIGRLLHDYHVVRESVRDAGRYLSRVEADCSSASPFYNAAEHESRAQNLVLRGDVNSSSPLVLGYWNDPDDVEIIIDCSITNSINAATDSRPYLGIYANVDFVPHVVVTATVPFTFLFGQLVTSSGTIDLILSHKVVSVGF